MIQTAQHASRLLHALLPDPDRLSGELDRVESALAGPSPILPADVAERLDLLAAVVASLRTLLPQLERGDEAADIGLAVSMRMLKHLSASATISCVRQ